jgi:hypothetical protein
MKNLSLLLFVASTTIILLSSSCGKDYSEKLKNLPDYVELMKTVERVDTFAGFPSIEVWKLVIDGRNHGGGPFVFDKEEPGYLAGISRGLDHALKNIDAPITVELLEKLRRLAVEEVSKTNETDFNPEIGGNGASFALILGNNATEKGLAALRDKLKNSTLQSVSVNESGSTILSRNAISRAELYPITKKIIDSYEASAKSLRDIIVLCQDLDQLHPFNDGNIRTFGVILFQKELARTKLTPSILFNPNRFDAYSVDEMSDEIEFGQKDFRSYL